MLDSTPYLSLADDPHANLTRSQANPLTNLMVQSVEELTEPNIFGRIFPYLATASFL